MRTKYIFICFLILFPLYFFLSSEARAERSTSLAGQIALRQAYDSNIDRTDKNIRSEWLSSLAPAIRITSSGQSDNIIFSYEPEFIFNHRTDEDRFDHYLLLDADKDFSQRWHAALHESFIRTEDRRYERDVEPATRDIVLSENREKTRFWKNSFSALTEFQYARESYLSLGYAHHKLDNDEQSFDDYTMQNPHVSIDHRFNQQWQSTISYGFRDGDFDQSNDIKSHMPSFLLTYRMTPASLFFGKYTFTKTNYKNDPADYTIQSGVLGLDHAFGRHTTFLVSGGTSYTNRETEEDERGITYSFNLNKTMPRGSLSLSGDGGFDELHYNGRSDGLSRFGSIKGDLAYQLLEKVSASIYALFRKDIYLERLPEEEEKAYEGGMSISYAFQRWYTLSLRYIYRNLDADIDVNDYDEHRLFLEFAISKDLWRW